MRTVTFTAQRIQFRGHSPRTISHGRPTPSFIPGRAGVEARPYGVWGKYQECTNVAPTPQSRREAP